MTDSSGPSVSHTTPVAGARCCAASAPTSTAAASTVRHVPGFLRMAEAPEPVACILIFPPPLSCTLAGGRTLFVADVGGGVSVDVTPATSLRIDVGDRMTRYPGPSFGRGRRVRDSSFFDHDFRLAVGAGWRF